MEGAVAGLFLLFSLIPADGFVPRTPVHPAVLPGEPLSLSSSTRTVNRLSAVAAEPINGSGKLTADSEEKNGSAVVNGGASDCPTWDIKLNVNEKARTVTSVCTSGTLCTVSGQDGIAGAPFGSYVDYVLDDDGNPVLLMNENSMHTVNIRDAGSEGLVTLFTQLGPQQKAQAGGQDVSRCSVTGRIVKIHPKEADDMDVIRMRYSIAHVYADQVMDSPKFAFYRLVPEKIYFVGGFGVLAKWVDPQDYKEANPDILAEECGGIIGRINRDHLDDLQLTATHLLGVEEDKLVKVRLTSVDRLGMDIRVTSQKGARRNKLLTDEFRIGFRIPVISVEDAKSEILKVFQEAWEKGNGYQWGDDDEQFLPGESIPIMQIAADDLE